MKYRNGSYRRRYLRVYRLGISRDGFSLVIKEYMPNAIYGSSRNSSP